MQGCGFRCGRHVCCCDIDIDVAIRARESEVGVRDGAGAGAEGGWGRLGGPGAVVRVGGREAAGLVAAVDAAVGVWGCFGGAGCVIGGEEGSCATGAGDGAGGEG